MTLAIDATPVIARRKGIGIVLDGLITASPPDSILGQATLFVDSTFSQEAAARWPGRELVPVTMRSSLLFEMVWLPLEARRRNIRKLLTARDRTAIESRGKTIVWLFEVPDHRIELIRASTTSLKARAAGTLAMSRFKSLAKRVSHYLVSSEFTRHDLIERYGVPDQRISLVKPGLSECYFEAESSQVARPPYVLHFATGDPRDNTDMALRAFALACRSLASPVELVLAGVPDGIRSQVLVRAEELGIGARTRITGYVDDLEMPLLFADAALYFDPTIFEGFGLQLAEAMASRTPVLASDAAAAAEVVGDAGVLRAHADLNGFAQAMVEILSEPSLAARLSANGRERARRFAWKAAVQRIDDVIRAV